MQEKTVWFGTEDDLVQVKCPSTELTRTRVAWRNSGTYLNGGGFALSSGTAHEEASISWGADSVDGFATLMTQLNKGEPLYYLDPLACKTNILPPYAAQYQPNNPFGFVAESATGANGYPSTAMKNLYTDRQIATVPVPEGYRLWVGCAGSSGGVSVDAPPPKWVEVGRNLATDPGATNDLYVWSGWNGDGGNGNHDKAIVSADWSKSESAVRITRGTVVVDQGDVYMRLPEVGTITAGATYTIAFSIRSLSDGQTFISPTLIGKGHTTISKYPTENFTLNAGDIQRVRYSFVASADTTASRRYLYLSWRGAFTGAQVELSMGDIYEGEYDTDRQWFSGDHAPEGMRSEWLGEPNNSVSVLYEQEGHPSDPEIPATPPNSGKRVTHSYPGGRAYHLFVRGGSVLQGVTAQILPNGVEPSAGGFIPGMGFSALALQDNPQITEYSAVLENYQMAMTANFIEVGSWM